MGDLIVQYHFKDSAGREVADLTQAVMVACGVDKRIVFDPSKPGGLCL